ncbi:MAG: outer membrane lipoprotein carrier protein LolA [Bacteroidia bacterium]|nr:outer membrane lipoprotein carrier protein LolA [Bacteroidia bacterium]
MKNTIALLLLFFGYQTMAQQAASPEKAKKILDEVSAKTKSYTTIQASFTYSLENKQSKVNEKQTGTLILKGQKFRLTLANQEVISDGKTVWVYMKESNEVQIKTVEDFNAESDINPTKIFTVYEQGFKFDYVKEATVNGKNLATVDLLPLDPKKKNYSRVRLEIDKVSKQIVSTKSFGKDGNTYTLTVSKFSTNQVFDDKQFTFDKSKYPGVEVVDLR